MRNLAEPWSLPDGWKWARFGDCLQLNYGKSLPAGKRNETGKHPVFGSGGKVGNHSESITKAPAIVIGRKGSIGSLFFSPLPCWPIDTTYYIDEFPPYIEPKYTFYFLQILSLEKRNKSAAIPGLNRDDVHSLSIPIPFPSNPIRSVETQRRIVFRIEALMAEIENARKMTDEMSRDAGEIMEATLNEIFLEEKSAHWQSRIIDDIAYVKGGKRLPKGATFSPVPTKWPYLRVVDFKNGSIDETDLRFLSDEVQRKISRYTISKDDVYISIAGTIGLVGTIPDKLNGANLTENAAKLVFKPFWKTKIDKKYLVYFLSSPSSRQQIRQRAFAAGQPKLALERVKTIPVFHPESIELQQRIVAYLDSLKKETEEIQRSINHDSQLLGQLEQSILDRAFRGEL
jgi:type I restriction enzyme S subunit